MQVAGVVTSRGAQHAADVLRFVQSLPDASALPSVLAHPPILIIPNVFEADLCRSLIGGYQQKGGRVSGFMRDVDGLTVEVQDARHKVRRDWSFDKESEPDLISIIQNRILKRVVPEIRKAFQFRVTRMERYLVSCYRAEEGGHFRAHRDDTTKGTAHRRFAVSLNLNAEDYEGGDLRFPEFGQRTYRPPTGGCCVFSCSLLHEATPVLKGERYAFLPFLYDEDAKKIRDQNLQFIAMPADQ
jgi:predicted 2-oxoglutarate/Fe(II)-dependent dioxygenase YbiX